MGENFHLFGGYRSGNDDVASPRGRWQRDFDTDLSQVNIGAGYRHGINERTDLVTEVSYINTEVEIEG